MFFKTSSYGASGPGVSVPYVRGLHHSDSDGSTTNSTCGMSLSSCSSCSRRLIAAAAIRPAVWMQRRYGDEIISVGHAFDAMYSPVALACFRPSPEEVKERRRRVNTQGTTGDGCVSMHQTNMTAGYRKVSWLSRTTWGQRCLVVRRAGQSKDVVFLSSNRSVIRQTLQMKKENKRCSHRLLTAHTTKS